MSWAQGAETGGPSQWICSSEGEFIKRLENHCALLVSRLSIETAAASRGSKTGKVGCVTPDANQPTMSRFWQRWISGRRIGRWRCMGMPTGSWMNGGTERDSRDCEERCSHRCTSSGLRMDAEFSDAHSPGMARATALQCDEIPQSRSGASLRRGVLKGGCGKCEARMVLRSGRQKMKTSARTSSERS